MNEPADLPALSPTASLQDEPARASGIARAAAIIALGSVSGRILGLARETVKSDLFGAALGVSAFQIASVVPIQLYELLVGGMITGGLVPVFSDYVEDSRRDELWRLLSTLTTLAALALVGLVVLAELAAPLITWGLGRGFENEAQQLAAAMLRITLPAVFFLSVSGILTALLYTFKRFSLPSFTSSAFNASIVAAALLLGPRLGVASMAVGILAGSILQIALQLPGLRGLRPRWQLDWRHPGLGRLAQLYGPVAASLIISQVAIYLSYSLASFTGESSIAWMNYATTLIQFPLGLVAMAVSTAILPTLSRQAFEQELNGFMATLAQGLDMVLLLIVPATVGLFVAAEPIIGLLFQHGQFSAEDTLATAQVLRFYLPGLTFAAIDLPLIYAFYARKDTLTPALVGLACILIYLLAALVPALLRPLRVTDLALANSIQWISHALIMLALLSRRVGRLQGVLRLAGQTLIGSLVMGGATWAALSALVRLVGGATLLRELIVVLGAGGVGLGVYTGTLLALKVEEFQLLLKLLFRARAP